MEDLKRTGWLAGFSDGEASFTLALKRNRRCAGGAVIGYEVVGIQPRFSIGLRADDCRVLDELCAVFGGSVHFHPRTTDGGERRDRYEWVVASKAGLRELIRYFDACPLRSKKANDYVIWRRAAILYLRYGTRHQELPVLREMLMGQRGYDESVVALRRAS